MTTKVFYKLPADDRVVLASNFVGRRVEVIWSPLRTPDSPTNQLLRGHLASIGHSVSPAGYYLVMQAGPGSASSTLVPLSQVRSILPRDD